MACVRLAVLVPVKRFTAAKGRLTGVLGDSDRAELARWMAQNWKDRALGMHELGTNGGLEGLSAGGRLPTRNFQDGQFEGAAEIGGQALHHHVGRRARRDRPAPQLAGEAVGA